MALPSNIIQQLQKNQITELDLSGKELTSDDIVKLAPALRLNHSLLSLDLHDNDIGNEGAIAIAKALTYNHTLTSLDMSAADIGNKGAIALAKSLENNHSLFELNLDDNAIRARGINAFGKVLKVNDTLAVLSIADNNYRYKKLKAFRQGLEANQTIAFVNLEDSDMTEEGTDDLMEPKSVQKLSEAILKSGNRNIVYVEPATPELEDYYKKNRKEVEALIAKIEKKDIDSETCVESKQRMPALLWVMLEESQRPQERIVTALANLKEAAHRHGIKISLPAGWENAVMETVLSRRVFINRSTERGV
jgi:Ran GTPase-activating protein (RanGAP) involved in mRNA processing and transport